MASAMLRQYGDYVYDEIEDRLRRGRDARDNEAVIYWYFVRNAVDNLHHQAA